jgi:hypothetical protein
VTPNPASGATVGVSITTTAPSQVAPRMPNLPWEGPWAHHHAPLLGLIALALLALVAAASRRRRSRASVEGWIPAYACLPKRSRRQAGMTSKRGAAGSLALALLLVAAWAGCGGGGRPGTPPGTYTVTLKAADTQANLSHSTTVTLTVNP